MEKSLLLYRESQEDLDQITVGAARVDEIQTDATGYVYEDRIRRRRSRRVLLTTARAIAAGRHRNRQCERLERPRRDATDTTARLQPKHGNPTTPIQGLALS